MRETANYILVGIATALIIYLVSPSILSTKVEIVEVNSANNTESSSLRTSYSDTFNKVKSSVVTIYTERNVPQRNHNLTIDPQTGQATQSEISSITVIGPNCLDADALATALNVMSLEDGLALVESLKGFEALWIIIENDKRFKSIISSGMPIAN